MEEQLTSGTAQPLVGSVVQQKLKHQESEIGIVRKWLLHARQQLQCLRAYAGRGMEVAAACSSAAALHAVGVHALSPPQGSLVRASVLQLPAKAVLATLPRHTSWK